MTALGIEASSLIPKPAFLGHATPSVTDFSGNIGVKKKRENAQALLFWCRETGQLTPAAIPQCDPFLVQGTEKLRKDVPCRECAAANVASAQLVQCESGSVQRSWVYTGCALPPGLLADSPQFAAVS